MTRPGAGGRPLIGEQRKIRLSGEDWEWIDRLAAANGIDRSAQVRQIIRIARVSSETANRPGEPT